MMMTMMINATMINHDYKDNGDDDNDDDGYSGYNHGQDEDEDDGDDYDHDVVMLMMMMIVAGFKSYVGYMHVEAAHTHPVVITFTRLMLLGLHNKRNRLLALTGSQALNGGQQREMMKREKNVMNGEHIQIGSKGCVLMIGPPH